MQEITWTAETTEIPWHYHSMWQAVLTKRLKRIGTTQTDCDEK